jgi:hypothetical protein
LRPLSASAKTSRSRRDGPARTVSMTVASSRRYSPKSGHDHGRHPRCARYSADSGAASRRVMCVAAYRSPGSARHWTAALTMRWSNSAQAAAAGTSDVGLGNRFRGEHFGVDLGNLPLRLMPPAQSVVLPGCVSSSVTAGRGGECRGHAVLSVRHENARPRVCVLPDHGVLRHLGPAARCSPGYCAGPLAVPPRPVMSSHPQLRCVGGEARLSPPSWRVVLLLILRSVSRTEKIIEQMRRSPQNVRFDDLAKVCAGHFGEPRQDAMARRSSREHPARQKTATPRRTKCGRCSMQSPS